MTETLPCSPCPSSTAPGSGSSSSPRHQPFKTLQVNKTYSRSSQASFFETLHVYQGVSLFNGPGGVSLSLLVVRPKTYNFSLGYLYQDKFSHFHLNLSLVNASGTLSGLVTGQVASQVHPVQIKPVFFQGMGRDMYLNVITKEDFTDPTGKCTFRVNRFLKIMDFCLI